MTSKQEGGGGEGFIPLYVDTLGPVFTRVEWKRNLVAHGDAREEK